MDIPHRRNSLGNMKHSEIQTEGLPEGTMHTAFGSVAVPFISIAPTAKTVCVADDKGYVIPTDEEEDIIWTDIKQELETHFKKDVQALCYIDGPDFDPPEEGKRMDDTNPGLITVSDQDKLLAMMGHWRRDRPERMRDQLEDYVQESTEALQGGGYEDQMNALVIIMQFIMERDRYDYLTTGLIKSIVSSITESRHAEVADGCIRICWRLCATYEEGHVETRGTERRQSEKLHLSDKPITRLLDSDIGLLDSLQSVLVPPGAHTCAPYSPKVLSALCLLMELSTEDALYHLVCTASMTRTYGLILHGYTEYIRYGGGATVDQTEALKCMEVTLSILGNCTHHMREHRASAVNVLPGSVHTHIIKSVQKISEEVMAMHIISASASATQNPPNPATQNPPNPATEAGSKVSCFDAMLDIMDNFEDFVRSEIAASQTGKDDYQAMPDSVYTDANNTIIQVQQLASSLILWTTQTNEEHVFPERSTRLLSFVRATANGLSFTDRKLQCLPSGTRSRAKQNILALRSTQLRMMMHRGLMMLWKAWMDGQGESKFQRSDAPAPLLSKDIELLLQVSLSQSRKKFIATCVAGILENAATVPGSSSSFLKIVPAGCHTKPWICDSLIRLMKSKHQHVRCGGASVLVGLIVNSSEDERKMLAKSWVYSALLLILLRKHTHAALQKRVAASIMLLSSGLESGALELNTLRQLVRVVEQARYHSMIPYVALTVWLLAHKLSNRQALVQLGAIKALNRWFDEVTAKSIHKPVLAAVWILTHDQTGAELATRDPGLLRNIIELAKYDHHLHPDVVHMSLNLLWNSNQRQHTMASDDEDDRSSLAEHLWEQLMDISINNNAPLALQLTAVKLLQYLMFGKTLSADGVQTYVAQITTSSPSHELHISKLVDGLLALMARGERILKRAAKEHSLPFGHPESLSEYTTKDGVLDEAPTTGEHAVKCLLHSTAALSVLASSPKLRSLLLSSSGGDTYVLFQGKLVSQASVRMLQVRQRAKGFLRSCLYKGWDVWPEDRKDVSFVAATTAVTAAASAQAAVAIARSAILQRGACGSVMMATLLSLAANIAGACTSENKDFAKFPVWPVLNRVLVCILNLSAKPDCQKRIGKHTQAFLTFLSLSQNQNKAATQARVLSSGILSNLAHHAANRTMLYKCELQLANQKISLPQILRTSSIIPEKPGTKNLNNRSPKENSFRLAAVPTKHDQPATTKSKPLKKKKKKTGTKGTKKHRMTRNFNSSMGLIRKTHLQHEMDSVADFAENATTNQKLDYGAADAAWHPALRGALTLSPKKAPIMTDSKFVNSFVVVGAIQREFKFDQGSDNIQLGENMSQQSLCKFPRIEGSRVTEGLFREYSEPDGSQTYYYRNGGAFEKAAAMVNPPPNEPISFADIWIDSLPAPPGSPAISIDSAMFPPSEPLGSKIDAPSTNEKLPTKDRPCMYVGLIAVDWPAQPPTPKPKPVVWVHEKHTRTWKNRGAGGFYDNIHSDLKVLKKSARIDASRLCAKQAVRNMIQKFGCVEFSNSDEAAMQAEMTSSLCEALADHYQIISDTFRYYAAIGSQDPFGIGLNEFAQLINDIPIEEEEYKSVSSSALDTMFVSCNVDVPTKGEKANKANIATYIEKPREMRKRGMDPTESEADDWQSALQLFVANKLHAHGPANALVPCDIFRKELLYTETMDDFLWSFMPYLKALFDRYSPPSTTKLSADRMDVSQWLELLEDVEFLDKEFTIKEAMYCFVVGKMEDPDEFNLNRFQMLSFMDFVEVLCRCACRKATASGEEIAACAKIQDQGADKIVAYHQLILRGDTDDNGEFWPLVQPPDFLWLKPVADTRSLVGRTGKVFALLFDRLREHGSGDGGASLCGDGALKKASSSFLAKMEAAYQLAVGKTPPKGTWRQIQTRKQEKRAERIAT